MRLIQKGLKVDQIFKIGCGLTTIIGMILMIVWIVPHL